MDRQERQDMYRRMAKAPMRAEFIRVGDGVKLQDGVLGGELAYASDGERYFIRPVIRSDMKGEVMGFAFHTVGWLRNDNRPNRCLPGLYRDRQNVYVRFEDGQVACVHSSILVGLDGVWEARIEQAARASGGEWLSTDVSPFHHPSEFDPMTGERFADLPPTYLWEGDVVRAQGFREHARPLDAYMVAQHFDDPQLFRVGGVHFYRGRGNGLPGWEEVNHEPLIAVADRSFLLVCGERNDSSYYTDQQCRLVERGPVWQEEREQKKSLTFHDLQGEANYRALRGQATEIGKGWHEITRELRLSEDETYAYEQLLCPHERALELVRHGEGHGISMVHLSIAKTAVEHYFVLRYHDEDLGGRVAKATFNDQFLVHNERRRSR